MDTATLDLTTTSPEKFNGEFLVKHLKKMRYWVGDCERIYAIIDNGSDFRSFKVRNLAADLNIELVYLPPYSPNLNLIERLWKLMNEDERNEGSFASATEFADAIKDFYKKKWPKIKKKHPSRFAENFPSFAWASF